MCFMYREAQKIIMADNRKDINNVMLKVTV